ncbi:VirK/YbjX family protein [Veillonella sp.]|uniref:VirK/YbjX family protein n=1 Tax=Veillonella sp. TaxID=1926307 RepID=UPI0029015A86|nr:DUF535 family protein [Veillonella sp.]MDU1672801.1 DUF535 family protein [Veillonella sp.]MDU1680652.1 DUF535 family protein [Veillonella sp.]MDU1743300.1 DUF535 family protein [Veillonella sp.]
MLQYIQNQWRKGRKIYGKHSWRETRRVVLHTIRSMFCRKQMNCLENYFANYKPDPDLLHRQIGLYELMTRIFFYKNSTVTERLDGIINHFDYIQNIFTDKAIQTMYSIDKDNFFDDVSRIKRGIMVWQSKELNMKAQLYYGAGQRKEGLLTLLLTLENQGVYHANFRFGKGFNGENAMWIGTIQGYRDGLDNAKIATKKMFGYRPKNFIMFLLRMIAEQCGVETIYAVSDQGFYANTHLVRGHRAKVAELDSLWQESGGELSQDLRFYIIPLEEYRKPIEEIKSQKRSQYRKRYDLLDQYQLEIKENLKSYIK